MPTYKITSQSGNPAELLQFVDEAAIPDQTLYPIYESGNIFTYDIKFYDVDPNSTQELIYEIESFAYSVNASGLNASQVDTNTIRVNGKVENVFIDSYFKFLTKDYEVKILPSTTTDYLTLVEWSPPSTSLTSATHSFEMMLINPMIPGHEAESHTITILQQVHWQWRLGLARFQEILSKGVF
jgi:hypothetical protein